ncbi:MAG: phage terminase large subunit family protein [Phycisphaerales bacterium]|nr:phage terminase large subunit family protein [Phycisphaerales bacterium]
MSRHALAAEVYDTLLPRPSVSTAEWACRHIVLPQDSNLKGNFRLDLFPHAREILDCCDDPEIEEITVQAASRMGKTMLSIAFIGKTGATDPHPMAFADADQKSTERVLGRMWRTFARCAPLAAVLPPERRRRSDRLVFATFTVEGAWAGSPATAADYPAYVVVLNECDKMKPRSTDTEADFRFLMFERAKGFGPGAKVLEISTPSLTDSSWIETRRLAGDNRARLVPCPHCNHFQELVTGNGKTPGGVRFERLNGRLDPQKARETAWYECAKCRRKIEEHQRYELLNSGLWVPEGCQVDKRGRIAGQPRRPGPHASFGPLSTLHSLLPGISIGRVAQEWVAALTARENRRERLRNFTNSWEARTWNPAPTATRPSDLADRLGCELPLGLVPDWGVFLTFGADVGQPADEYVFYWCVCAWGLFGRGHLVDYGLAWGKEQAAAAVRLPFSQQGRPGELTCVEGAIDSSNFTDAIYQLCRPVAGWWPIKGSSQSGFPDWYRPSLQGSDLPAPERAARIKLGAYDLLEVNTHRSQSWLEDRLNGLLTPQERDQFTIPRAALIGEPRPGIDLPRQLLGDYRDGTKWVKRYDDQHLRDALRYARVAAEHYTKNGERWSALESLQETPAGNGWFAKQRRR